MASDEDLWTLMEAYELEEEENNVLCTPPPSPGQDYGSDYQPGEQFCEPGGSTWIKQDKYWVLQEPTGSVPRPVHDKTEVHRQVDTVYQRTWIIEYPDRRDVLHQQPVSGYIKR